MARHTRTDELRSLLEEFVLPDPDLDDFSETSSDISFEDMSDEDFCSDVEPDSDEDDLGTSDDETNPAKTSTEHSNNKDQQKPTWAKIVPPEKRIDVLSNFKAASVGPTNCPSSGNPLEYFSLYFTDVLWLKMVECVNTNAQKELAKLQRSKLAKRPRQSKWVNVTVEEMHKFWAMLILMGVREHVEFDDFWSNDPLLCTNFFAKCMTYKRFKSISSLLYGSSDETPGNNSWLKIGDFIIYMNEAFKKCYVPAQEIRVDESAVGVKNGKTFIDYNPDSDNEDFLLGNIDYHVRKFELCDSTTNYVYHISLLRDREFSGEEKKTFNLKAIKELMEQSGLLNQWYHLFVESSCIKVPLAIWLWERNTFLTATLTKISKEVSGQIDFDTLNVGNTLYFRRGPLLLVGYKKSETKRPKFMITTACHAENEKVEKKGGGSVNKPILLTQYSKHLDGIDGAIKDKSCFQITSRRGTKAYWRKIMFDFVDVALLNAYIIYATQNNKKLSRYDFLKEIVRSLAKYEDIPEYESVSSSDCE